MISDWRSWQANRVVDFVVKRAVGKVLSPATKLWNTGQGATLLRQAVSLMGGFGITQDCPGFLPQKWMDSQLEATYEGPESVQRRQLIVTMTSELFLAQFRKWTSDMSRIASDRPGTGACTIAAAMELWLWSLNHLQHATDADGEPLYRDKRQGATFPMADALCWLLASYYQILDVVQLEEAGGGRCRVSATRCPVTFSSSPICATCNRLARRAKSRASARNWCSATIAIPVGNPIADRAWGPGNWMCSKDSFPAFRSASAWPAM